MTRFASTRPAALTPIGKTATPVIDRLRDLTRNGRDYRVALLRLSALPLVARRPAILRLIQQEFVRCAASQLTVMPLPNSDLVVAIAADSADPAGRALERICTLLGFGSEDDDCTPPSTLLSWYDPSDAGHIALLAQRIETICAERARDSRCSRRSAAAGDVARLSSRLQAHSSDDLIHHQAVITFNLQASVIRPLFHEFFVSIAALETALSPGVDVLANGTLFKLLTKSLDQYMLSSLRVSNQLGGDQPFSLNLNLESLDSDAFDTFRKCHVNTSPYVEVQFVDLLSSPEPIEDLQQRLSQNGMKLIVDGLGLTELDCFDLDNLPSAFIKLWWNQASDAGMAGRRSRTLRERIARIGSERFILARVDSEDAVRWAAGAGISHLQGRFIDRLFGASGGPKAP